MRHNTVTPFPLKRTLHFPSEASLGVLFVRRYGKSALAPWKEFGDAIGDITIPAGIALRLVVAEQPFDFDLPLQEAEALLPSLSTLQRDDLQSLSLEPLYSRLRDFHLKYLSDLPGIEELLLRQTSISGAGIANLHGWSALKNLDVSWTEIDATGLNFWKPCLT